MATERQLTKQLGGVDDLTLGDSTEEQTRGGSKYTITQVSGATLPYSAAAGATIKAKIDAAQAVADSAQTDATAAQADATTALNALPLKVDKTGDTGSAILPSGTTAQRDGSPAEGYTRINTDNGELEVYTNGAWLTFRSEERRVGKECRSRWSA